MITCLFVGRFQPLHLGHVHAINHAKKMFGDVVIIIGSSTTKRDFDNPFTFKERKKMIELVFDEKCRIIGIPDVFDDEKWVKSIEEKTNFDVVVTGNEWTKRCFLKADYRVIEPDFLEPDKYNATNIRKKMGKDEKWEDLVPKKVVDFIKLIGGVERIKKLKESGKS